MTTWHHSACEDSLDSSAEPDGRSPDDGELIVTLARLGDAMAAMSARAMLEATRRCETTALSGNEIQVLARLSAHPGLPLRELGERIGLGPRALAAVVDGLRRRDLLSFDQHPREPRYRPSPAAMELLQLARKRAVRHLRYAASSIAPDDRRRLREAHRTLESLASALGADHPR